MMTLKCNFPLLRDQTMYLFSLCSVFPGPFLLFCNGMTKLMWRLFSVVMLTKHIVQMLTCYLTSPCSVRIVNLSIFVTTNAVKEKLLKCKEKIEWQEPSKYNWLSRYTILPTLRFEITSLSCLWIAVKTMFLFENEHFETWYRNKIHYFHPICSPNKLSLLAKPRSNCVKKEL